MPSPIWQRISYRLGSANAFAIRCTCFTGSSVVFAIDDPRPLLLLYHGYAQRDPRAPANSLPHVQTRTLQKLAHAGAKSRFHRYLTYLARAPQYVQGCAQAHGGWSSTDGQLSHSSENTSNLRGRLSCREADRLDGASEIAGMIPRLQSMKACKTFMPKYLSQITLVRATDGVALPPNPLEGVVLSSTSTSWQSLVVEEHHWSSGSCQVNEDVKYMQHVITVNIGRSVTAQYRKDGRFRHVTKPKGAISLFPSQRPFFRRVGSGENGASDFRHCAGIRETTRKASFL